MSLALSNALQAAVYQRLSSHAVLQQLIGPAVFDQPPPGTDIPETFVMIGAERVRDRSAVDARASVHELEIVVETTEPRFATAKAVAATVAEALEAPPLTLAQGHLVSIGFRSARARRLSGGQRRRIAMVFRAFVEDV
ncbi:MAG: DUF3168 domain-containing protein [Alphaproteobacteria bacterium]|nr:MAG: DUF3168 domain-containing protein [Alphaproteobacteria bacterium]